MLRGREILPTPTASQAGGNEVAAGGFSMIMNASDSEGLGLSVLVYVGAILGAVALLAVPAYYAFKPQVYDNPPLAQPDPLLNTPMIGDRAATRFPLAVLQPQTVADAETAKWRTAKARKRDPARRAIQQTARRTVGTPVAELQTERGRPAIFPFSLF